MKASSLPDNAEWWSGYSLEFCILVERKFTNLYFCTWSISKDALDFPLIDHFSVGFFHCFTWLLVENSSKIQCGEKNLVSTSLRKKKTYEMMFAMLLYLIRSIQRRQQLFACTHTNFRSCRVSLRLWSDNVNWSSCMCVAWCAVL